MIGGGAAESDDNLVLAFLVFSEVPEQCFALFRIERDLLLRGRFTELGGSLVVGELLEQGDASDEIIKEIVALSRV